MPRLLLIRHAESENNHSNARIRRAFAGDPQRIHLESEQARKPDPDLSETGVEQARLLAEALGDTLRTPRTLLLVSPMRRALQTATPLAAAAGIPRERFRCHPRLYEVGGSYYCGEVAPSTTAAQIEAAFPVQAVEPASWEGGWYHEAGPETAAQARARIDGLLTWLEATLATGEHEQVVVVAHGDLLTRWLRRWLQVPAQRSLTLMHGNTGVSALWWRAGDEGGLLLAGFNDLGHLPPALRTGGDVEVWWRYGRPDRDLVDGLG